MYRRNKDTNKAFFPSKAGAKGLGLRKGNRLSSMLLKYDRFKAIALGETKPKKSLHVGMRRKRAQVYLALAEKCNINPLTVKRRLLPDFIHTEPYDAI